MFVDFDTNDFNGHSQRVEIHACTDKPTDDMDIQRFSMGYIVWDWQTMVIHIPIQRAGIVAWVVLTDGSEMRYVPASDRLFAIPGQTLTVDISRKD